MKLSRCIPARTKTINFIWCKRDFTRMDESFKRIRPNKTQCQWCTYVFEDGDLLGLAAPVKGKNIILCQVCVNDLIGGNVNFKRMEDDN